MKELGERRGGSEGADAVDDDEALFLSQHRDEGVDGRGRGVDAELAAELAARSRAAGRGVLGRHERAVLVNLVGLLRAAGEIQQLIQRVGL
eukprot:784016-Prymnesium_polylepis.1